MRARRSHSAAMQLGSALRRALEQDRSPINRVVATNVGEPPGTSTVAVAQQAMTVAQRHGSTKHSTGGGTMTNPNRDAEELTAEELLEEDAAELPDREAMSLINANIAIPVNAAVAANVLSDGATAYANAIQQDPIEQGT